MLKLPSAPYSEPVMAADRGMVALQSHITDAEGTAGRPLGRGDPVRHPRGRRVLRLLGRLQAGRHAGGAPPAPVDGHDHAGGLGVLKGCCYCFSVHDVEICTTMRQGAQSPFAKAVQPCTATVHDMKDLRAAAPGMAEHVRTVRGSVDEAQAGIAIGLAKSVAARFPEWGPDFAALMYGMVRPHTPSCPDTLPLVVANLPS